MDIIPAKKENIIFDATLLSAFMGCARMTDFRYNQLLVSEGKGNSLETGSIVHTVLEYFYKSKIQGLSREQSIAAGMTMGELYIKGCQYCTGWKDTENKPPCGHAPDSFPGVKNTPMESVTTPRNFIGWKHALNTCEQYFEFYKNDHWVPLFVEQVKSKIIYEDDNLRVLWKAKLDLGVDTNQGIFPVDHKTMKQRRDTISLNNQFMGQCIIMGTRTAIINKIGFQTSLKDNEKFTRVPLNYSADRLLEWQGEIVPYYAYQMSNFVRNNVWPPNFDHCETKYGFCDYREVCESDRGMREDVFKLNFVKGVEWNPVNADE